MKYIGWVVAIVLAVLLLQKCSQKCPVCPELREVVKDTVYTPKQEQVRVYVPLAQKKARKGRFLASDTIFDHVSVFVYDTIRKNVEIPGEPCDYKIVSDTQKIGSSGYVVINDLIYGSILERNFSIRISELTPPAIKSRSRWYGGVDIIPARSAYAGVGLGWQPPKSRTLITIGAGIQNGQVAGKVGIFTQLNRAR